MCKLNINKLESVVNYYDVQKDFYKHCGEEPFSFDELYEKGFEDDDYPFFLDDFKKLKIKGYKSVRLTCNDRDDKTTEYLMCGDCNTITIKSTNFSMKECLTVINLLEAQLNYSKTALHIAFGTAKESDGRFVGTKYAEESSVFGMWWENFVDKFNEVKENLLGIKITIIPKEENQDNYTTLAVILVIDE